MEYPGTAPTPLLALPPLGTDPNTLVQGYVFRENSTTALETVMVHLETPAPNGCARFKLEVTVRRRMLF